MIPINLLIKTPKFKVKVLRFLIIFPINSNYSLIQINSNYNNKLKFSLLIKDRVLNYQDWSKSPINKIISLLLKIKLKMK